MANLTTISLDDPVDASLAAINGNFAALNAELGAHTHSFTSLTGNPFTVSGARVYVADLVPDAIRRRSGVRDIFFGYEESDTQREDTVQVLFQNYLRIGFTGGVLYRGFISANAYVEEAHYGPNGFVTWKPTYAPDSGSILTPLQNVGWLWYGVNWNGDDTPKQLSQMTPLFSILHNGNVGIGTHNPVANLHVEGTSRLAGNTEVYGELSLTAGADYQGLRLWRSNAVLVEIVANTAADNQGLLALRHAKNAPSVATYLAATGSSRLRGALRVNVGANDVWPAEALHVNGNGLFSGNVYAQGNVGIGTTSPQHHLHINATQDWTGFRLDRGGNVMALLHQNSSGGKLYLYDSAGNARVALDGSWVSKVHGALGVNLPANEWPGFHLHVSESSQALTSVRVENNSGLSGAGADLRMYAWSGTNAPRGAFFVGGSSRGTKGNASPLTTGDRMAALIGVGQQTSGADALGTGGMIEITAASNWNATNRQSNVSIRINGPNQAAFPPAERLRIEGVGALAIPNAMQTPDAPAVSSEAKIYVRNNKLIVQYNDAGTVRYKWLDLNGTGVTWQHSTTAP